MTDAPAPPSRRKLALVALVPAALVAAFVISSVLAARDRVLHVINAAPGKATVRLDGGEPLEVPSGVRLAVPIAEGEHVAEVERDGKTSTVPLPMRTSFLTRLGALPAWVLNIEGAAPLLVESAIYAEGVPEPRPPRILFGDPFVALEEVHVAFERFPEEVEGATVALTRIDLFPGEPAAVLARLPRTLPPSRLMDWAELRLRLDPTDEALLQGYRDLISSEEEWTRCTAFLEGGLERRPTVVAWHRAYQDLLRARGREEELAARYAQWVQATPADAGLLYLAGRIEAEAPAALARYDAALAADASNGFAWHGKAFLAFARADLDEALRCATKACELRAHDAEMAAFRDDVRFALGRYDELQTELEAILDRRPFAVNAHRRLLEVLAAKDDATGLEARHDAFVAAVRKGAPESEAERLRAVSQLALADLEGDATKLLEAARNLPSSLTRSAHELAANLLAGRVAEAAAVVERGPLAQGQIGRAHV